MSFLRSTSQEGLKRKYVKTVEINIQYEAEELKIKTIVFIGEGSTFMQNCQSRNKDIRV